LAKNSKEFNKNNNGGGEEKNKVRLSFKVGSLDKRLP
jgi:hypothetical protein